MSQKKKVLLASNTEAGYILGNLNFNPQTIEEKNIFIKNLDNIILGLDKSSSDYQKAIELISTFKLPILCSLGNKEEEISKTIKFITNKYIDILDEYKKCIQ